MGVRGMALAALLVGCGGPGDVGSAPDCDDTSSDTYHCGACDHTCWGSPCVAGACQPDVVFPGTTQNWVADGNIVASGPVGPSVYARRLDSYRHLSLDLLALGDNSPDGRFVDIEGTSVFWTQADGIYQADIEARPVDPVRVVAGATDDQSWNWSRFAVLGDTVVFHPPLPLNVLSSEVAPSIRRCTLGDCESPETIYTGPVLGTAINQLEANGTILAFVEGTELRICDLDDCQATVQTVGVGLVSFWPNRPPVLAIADGHIAWKEFTVDDRWQDARVLLCTPPACASPTVIHETFDPAPELLGLAIFEDEIYIGLDTVPGLVRCPLDGCGGAPEPIPWIASATEPPEIISGSVQGDIAVSEQFFVIGGGKVTR